MLPGTSQATRKSKWAEVSHRPSREGHRIGLGIAHRVWPGLIHNIYGGVAVDIRKKGDDERRTTQSPVFLGRRFFDDLEPLLAQSGLDVVKSRLAVRQKAHTLCEKALRHVAGSESLRLTPSSAAAAFSDFERWKRPMGPRSAATVG